MYLLVELTDRSAPLQGQGDYRGGKIFHGLFTDKTDMLDQVSEVCSKRYNFTEEMTQVVRDEIETYDDVSLQISEKEWFNMYVQDFTGPATDTVGGKVYMAESLYRLDDRSESTRSHFLLAGRYIDLYNAFVLELVNEFTTMTLTMIKSRIQIDYHTKSFAFRGPREVRCEWKEIILS